MFHITAMFSYRCSVYLVFPILVGEQTWWPITKQNELNSGITNACRRLHTGTREKIQPHETLITLRKKPQQWHLRLKPWKPNYTHEDGQLNPNMWTPRPESASELYRPSERHLSAKLVPSFVDMGCRVVIVTDSYSRNLGCLDRSRYSFFQVAPQLYSRGWVDTVPDPLPLRKSGSAGILTRTSGSVTRNSDH
jgi:hypothetical protein